MTTEKGALAKIHAELLAKISGIARALDLEIASAEETRQILGLGAYTMLRLPEMKRRETGRYIRG